MNDTIENQGRQYGLDWVRVLAFGLLIFYHTGMFFVTWDFHLKNPETSKITEIWMLFMNQWRLSLLFFISGAGTWYALGRRTGGQFARERVVRLLLPLVFGMLVVVPPQIYVERLAKHQFSGSYAEWYPSVFQGVPYPEGGSVSWHHLWFVLYLLCYSLVALPLFLHLRSARGQAQLARFTDFITRGTRIYWLCLPAWLSLVLLQPDFESNHGLVADWHNHATYLSIFILGFVLLSQPRLLAFLQERRRVNLFMGIGLVAAMYVFFWLPNRDVPGFGWMPHTDQSPRYEWAFFCYRTLKALNSWCWILAICGYALHYLNFGNAFLRYANEAVYPFYILHQSVMLPLGYLVIGQSWGLNVKFWIIAVGMFVLTWALYDWVVKRTRLTRLLFGLKPRQS
jgi:glucans biosynthesis protein C